MKKVVVLLFIGVILASCENAPSKDNVSLDLNDENNKLSYSLGVVYGTEMQGAKERFEFFNQESFLKGFNSSLKGDSVQVDYTSAQQILNEYSSKQRDVEINKNISEGDAYLKENGARVGVVTLDNGMQYEILSEGTGAKPTETDRVSVHYHGTLIDGTVFDSSIENGTPIEFGVTEVIQGWTQILKMMPVGSKWKVSIPYNLAYGANGGGPIPPYATLIFEMELLEIVK